MDAPVAIAGSISARAMTEYLDRLMDAGNLL
jgi:hypothetical protein